MKDDLGEQRGPVLVIKGGTLIDGNGGPPIRDSLLVIRGNRFERISRNGTAEFPADAKVINATGKFIMPGLIDAHLHYSGFLAELLLNRGVTTAFDIAGLGMHQVVRREAIARGRIAGPRLFVCVDSVVAPTERGHTAYDPEGPRRALSLEQATEVARRAIAAGADFVNIRRGLTREAFKATVDVVHKAGLAVIAQPIGPEVYAREAVLAGADILEHAAGVSYSVAKDPSHWKGWGNRELDSLDVRPFAEMDEAKADDLIHLMVAHNVFIEPDLVAQGRGLHRQSQEWEAQDSSLLSDSRLAYIPEGVRQKWLDNYKEFKEWSVGDRTQLRKGYENYEKFVRRFVEAGGKVLTGDDASFSGWAVPGLGVQRELELLVDAGLAPMQAIMAATRNPAEAFRILDQLGTVESGKFADLVILEADPLENIRNIQRIALVVKDGKILNREYHADFSDPFAGDALQSSPEWYAALKRVTDEGIRTLAGLTDPTSAFGQPCPGIESLTPPMASEGEPTLMLTIKGVNFTTKSSVYWGGEPIRSTRVSETEIQATIDEPLIARAGIFPIEVKNPGPVLAQPKWGNVSNRLFFVVNFNSLNTSARNAKEQLV